MNPILFLQPLQKKKCLNGGMRIDQLVMVKIYYIVNRKIKVYNAENLLSSGYNLIRDYMLAIFL